MRSCGLLLGILTLTACGSDGGVASSGGIQDLTVFCTASVIPGTVDFTVQGDQLTLTSEGEVVSLLRLSTVGSGMDGEWLLLEDSAIQSGERISIRGVVTFEEDRMTITSTCDGPCGRLVAEASSTIERQGTLTAGTLEILESDEDFLQDQCRG